MNFSNFQLGSYETVLAPGELVSAILIPPPTGLSGLYIKFTTGSSEERPCAGIAAFARMENGTRQELRLAVGAVSAKPLRITAGEAMARHNALTGEAIAWIATEAARAVDPIDDVRGPADYKHHVVGVLVRRAVTAVAAGKAEQTL